MLWWLVKREIDLTDSFIFNSSDRIGFQVRNQVYRALNDARFS